MALSVRIMFPALGGSDSGGGFFFAQTVAPFAGVEVGSTVWTGAIGAARWCCSEGSPSK